MAQRISRPNPYILPAGDVEHILRFLTPDVAQNIATVVGISFDEWQALDPKMQAKHFIDWQNGGLIAATAVQTKRAYQDLEALASPVVQDGDGTSVTTNRGPAPVQPVLHIAQKAI